MKIDRVSTSVGQITRRVVQNIPLIYLPILISPILLLAPVWAAGKVLFWGTPFLQFVPWKQLAWDTLLSGHLPLWNPMVGMGAPLLANYQSALIYPGTWFLFLLSALGGVAWLAWGQTLFVIFHLIWSGLGMALLGKRLKFNALAQVVAGVSFELCGYLVARAGFLSINAAVAWLPWIMLAGYCLAVSAASFKLKNIVPLTVCMGMQLLAGHAQTTFYTFLLLFLWMAFWGWRQAGWRKCLLACGQLILAGFLAGALTAVQLLPTFEYLQQSQRASSVGYDFAMNYSFFPMRLFSLLAGNLFGSPAQGNYMLKADNYWEDAIYIGLLPFLLAVYAVFRLIPRTDYRKQLQKLVEHEKPLIAFLLISIIVSILLALGKYFPLFPFLYRFVPTFNMFQAPARWTLWLEFGLALLAGIGVNAWHRPRKRALYWTNLGTAAGVAVMLGSILGLIYLPGTAAPLITAVAIAGFLVLATGLLAHFAPTENDLEPGRVWKWVVLAVITLDLLVVDWGINPGASSALYQDSTNNATVTALIQGHRLYIDPVDETAIKFSRFFIFNSFILDEPWTHLQDVYLPDSGILSGISSANNFDPLVPDRYARWMDYLASASTPTKKAMLNLMDVGADESVDKKAVAGVSFTPVPGSSKVWWSPCGISANSTEEAWNLTMANLPSMAHVGVQNIHPIIVEGDKTVVEKCDSSAGVEITTLVQNPARTVFQSQSSSAGYLLWSNVWYPGWQVNIDGKRTNLLNWIIYFRVLLFPRASILLSLYTGRIVFM